jgi:hypothetical protein
MTRKEQVTNKVKEIMHESRYNAIPSTLFEMATWADKTMIEKACEILKNVTVTYNKRFFGKCEENAFDADFIKEFRKALEE